MLSYNITILVPRLYSSILGIQPSTVTRQNQSMHRDSSKMNLLNNLLALRGYAGLSFEYIIIGLSLPSEIIMYPSHELDCSTGASFNWIFYKFILSNQIHNTNPLYTYFMYYISFVLRVCVIVQSLCSTTQLYVHPI